MAQFPCAETSRLDSARATNRVSHSLLHPTSTREGLDLADDAGGPPCQGLSCANTKRIDASHGIVIHSRNMLREFVRLAEQFEPDWFLCENAPIVPDIRVVPAPRSARPASREWRLPVRRRTGLDPHQRR